MQSTCSQPRSSLPPHPIYPYLMVHVGNGTHRERNISWKGGVVLVLSKEEGIVVFEPPTLPGVELGKKINIDFSASCWQLFNGKITLEN